MAFGDSEIVREEGNTHLLKIEGRYEKISYCVLGNGPTLHYDNYEDALDEFNLRWMREKFGE